MLRTATLEDISNIERLIEESVHQLQAEHYTEAQRNAALGSIFGVDSQLIKDGTYYVIEDKNKIIACGGWSYRSSLFGSDAGKDKKETKLIPGIDAARIRAFFVSPKHSRKGLGKRLLLECEKLAIKQGFNKFALVATLSGELLYQHYGFQASKRYEVPMSNGELLPVVAMSKTIASTV